MLPKTNKIPIALCLLFVLLIFDLNPQNWAVRRGTETTSNKAHAHNRNFSGRSSLKRSTASAGTCTSLPHVMISVPAPVSLAIAMPVWSDTTHMQQVRLLELSGKAVSCLSLLLSADTDELAEGKTGRARRSGPVIPNHPRAIDNQFRGDHRDYYGESQSKVCGNKN
jgi:hypothetical protein